MGYAGGLKEKPTYRSIGDHTEAISIDYDPKVISYEKLLGYFWSGHYCGSVNRSRQYLNAVFYRNADQKKRAEASKEAWAVKIGKRIEEVQTQILPIREFTYAEGYHQKYSLRSGSAVRDFLVKTYPSAKMLADSTVATHLNAYLGGGSGKDWNALLAELPQYGLPPAVEAEVRRAAGQ